MNNYEIVYIIKADLEQEETAAVVEKYSTLIAEHGGEVVNVDEWGKRRLAYEIMKNKDGYYVLAEFKSVGDFVQEIERVMRIDENILKFLVTRKEY